MELFKDKYKSRLFTYEDINVLFPKGYTTLIEMYLEEINSKKTVKSQNINQRNKNKLLECLAIKCNFTFDKISIVQSLLFLQI